MRKIGGRHLAGCDHDPRAHLGPVPHLHGKCHRHADATMRCRITGEHPRMDGDARPRDPLHVRHRRAAIDVGVVQLLLLDDAENAHRRWMTGHAAGNRGFREKPGRVVNLQPLVLDRDRDDQRSLRLGCLLQRRLDLFSLTTPSLLPPLRDRRTKLRKSWLGIRPVIQRGFRMRGGADRSGCRQSRNSPKPAGRNRRNILTHAYHPRIPVSCLVVADEKRVHQRKASTPAIFAPSVAKKPHHQLTPNSGGHRAAFLPDFRALPPTENFMTSQAVSPYDTKSLPLVLFLLAWVLWPGSAFAADEPDLIFRRSTVFKFISPNDKLATYGVDDPEVEGVACHFTVPEKGGFKGWLGLAEEVSDISLACRQIGPIHFKGKMEQGDDMFRLRRSLFFKKMQIVRGCDAKRNVLVYMVYSDKLIEGSPKNSTSSVPIMPWGAADAAVQKCGEFVQ